MYDNSRQPSAVLPLVLSTVGSVLVGMVVRRLRADRAAAGGAETPGGRTRAGGRDRPGARGAAAGRGGPSGRTRPARRTWRGPVL
ncbi:hypothetical protein ACH9DO_14545 [Kocuria sp. M1N1S27]|uniref:hypothetical protein n=1 Tax=Kocuria kalidii TaxID=3376283 RepID=UPI00379206E8